jgi:hypothetical protein
MDNQAFLGVITNDDIAEVFQVMGATMDSRQRNHQVAAPQPSPTPKEHDA